jgi:single-stranded-DNA-specific exonuclease
MWVYPTIDEAWCHYLTEQLRIHPVISQILVSRGFKNLDEIQSYLYAKLPDLLDPYLMNDMDKAVERVCRAVESNENILIYGDNDVDGMTGTALLTEFLRNIGAQVVSHVPNRNNLNQTMMSEALNIALKYACKLLITVDCGITAAREIEQVVSQGIDVIVTDHHEPTAKLPLCVATLNPKLFNNPYPNRELTGVGVAFKLAHAITNTLVKSGKLSKDQVDLKRYLDLVALGTIADMGVLLDENRVLVRYGLRQLRKTRRIGLKKLFDLCEIRLPDINSADVASKVAPRLNSLGRIADPQKGVELLLVRDPETAENLAKELDLNNLERQRIEQLMSMDVERYLEQHPEIFEEKAIVLDSDKWHPGVIPIVTTRISKLYNRPTLMIAVDNSVGKGSIRTIREFPLLPVLKECAELLLNFGGHDYAAGLTIESKNIPQLRQRFITKANAMLKDQDIVSKLHIDARANFDELTFDFMESLSLLEPHGNENMAPILYTEAVQVRPPKIIGTSHLKLYLVQNDRHLEGIAFGMAERRHQLKGKDLNLKVAFTPQINTFQNKISIQLLIRDFIVL